METDLHLLSRYHRHGDAEAFQSLVESHAGMVHATACRVTRNAALAQDVAQETFLALARSGGAAIQSVGAWLHHVAWQKARDQVRGESRRQSYEATASEYLHEPAPEAEWADLEPLLDEALAELPVSTRTLIIGRFLEGHTQQQMAERLGMSQSTVSRMIERGVDELRVLLKARGVVCGAGLAVLLSTHGAQAAPSALMTSLGKLGISGAGVSTATFTLTHILTSILMKAQASKLALLAAALVLVGGAGYDMASPHSRLLGLFGGSKPDVAADAAPAATSSREEPKARAALVSPALAAIRRADGKADSVSLTSSATPDKDSAQSRLAKLAGLSKEADFKNLVVKLFATGDPRQIAGELKRLMGIDLKEREVAAMMRNPAVLEIGILTTLASRHPQETLAWMAMRDENDRLMTSVVYPNIFKNHPEITAGSVAASLPEGPNRAEVLRLLRAQSDPQTEAQLFLSTEHDLKTRLLGLWDLAELWPKGRQDEAVAWALQNLKGMDLNVFLPRVMHHLSCDDPDAALALMNQIKDPELLSHAVIDSLYGLVNKTSRMADVVPLISSLQGKQRSDVITELTRKWVRVDQEGLMQWINGLESAADFEAALPLTLPQLTPENYTKAMDSLMAQLDGKLDAAIIKAAMPELSNATRTTMDIVQRLTRLPQYRSVGAGQQGNQELLWQAVNKMAEGWVSKQGAKAPEGARWIDGLAFRSPADKAAVAGKLYQQWKLSDPGAARNWAVGAGVKVP